VVIAQHDDEVRVPGTDLRIVSNAVTSADSNQMIETHNVHSRPCVGHRCSHPQLQNYPQDTKAGRSPIHTRHLLFASSATGASVSRDVVETVVPEHRVS
jgi:hypothetical protein